MILETETPKQRRFIILAEMMKQGKTNTYMLNELNKMISEQNELRRENSLIEVERLTAEQLEHLKNIARSKNMV